MAPDTQRLTDGSLGWFGNPGWRKGQTRPQRLAGTTSKGLECQAKKHGLSPKSDREPMKTCQRILS